MVGNTVQYTVQNGLCCGCGVCKGLCPRECICWEEKNGLFLPHIDTTRCIDCGLCAAVCPGLGHTFEEKKTAEETVTGPYLDCCNAWSKDAVLRHISASGGVVSTMIRALLKNGIYDGAFCLDSYDYHDLLKTRLYTTADMDAFWHKSNAPKSRYLPVSHENAVAYIKSNRSSRLIFVGTSCAIRGLRSAIKKLNLNTEQYLFIGLFCDKVFNYNVLSYFEDTYTAGTPLEALHFKNKESGGWPGDMKLFPQGREPFYVPLSERVQAKAYFMPERCLYCVDKLNTCADISLGDNYTGTDDSPLGSNSVIIRTDIGLRVWKTVLDELEIAPVAIEAIQSAQYLTGRLNNLYFGQLKETQLLMNIRLNTGIPTIQNCQEYTRAWHTALKKIACGAQYRMMPQKLTRQQKKDRKKEAVPVRFLKRVYHYLQRNFMR